MRRLQLFLFAFALGALAAPGLGADDRSAVQAEVERALARLERLDPSGVLSYGAVEVVPESGAYGVTVADVAVKLAPNDPGVLDIGIVSFRLLPAAGNLYRIDRVQTADAFAHRGADGEVDGIWRLVPRRLSGLWSQRQGGFLRRDAAVDINLAITGLDAVVSAVTAAPPQPGSDLRRLQLILFRALAKRQAGADGAAIDRYDIHAAASGPVVVNGRAFDIGSN